MESVVKGQITKRKRVAESIGGAADDTCDKTSSRSMIRHVCKESKCAEVINWQHIPKRTVNASDRYKRLRQLCEKSELEHYEA